MPNSHQSVQSREDLANGAVTAASWRMDIGANRVGKLAILAAVTSDDEEERLKGVFKDHPRYRLTLTTVAGLKSDVQKAFVRSIVGCALKGGLIENKAGAIHAVIHAGLEALNGVMAPVPIDSSVKLKVAIARDPHWIVVAAYGDSAFHPETNHERMGLGVMHI